MFTNKKWFIYLKKNFIAVSCSFIVTILPAQTRHALIVAIGNYPNPDENLWPLIKNALVNNQGFAEKNVQVLTDAQATKKGIVDALDKLIATVKKGDIVVIHISSHGHQIEDDNNDEMDGLDEVIVPYGAVASYDQSKFTELAKGYLRDDLFGEKITVLRNKLGKDGDVLVTLDACHSGSGTRDVPTTKIRGGNAAMVSSTFKPGNFPVADKAGVFKENTSTKLSIDAATFVLISGAQAKEVNYECYDDNRNPVGSLSYAFSKALCSLKGEITYQGLFSIIESIMIGKAPKQKPVLEGDGVNRELFGGKYEKQQPYFSINIKQSKNDLISLNAGFVSGITIRSVINFYEPGTTTIAGKKPLGAGKVMSASAFTATVKMDSSYADIVKLNPWAFVNELAYGTEKLKLFIKGDKVVEKMLKDSLKDFKLVEFNAINCDLFLDTSASLTNWALKDPNTNTVFQSGFNFTQNQNSKPLKEALKQYDRFRYLKGLQFNDPDISAAIHLVFKDVKGNTDSARLKSRTNLGRLELKEGDNVSLEVINTGKKDFYINMVDIQPDGIINAVLPNKKALDKNGNPYPVTWEACLVKRNDTLRPCNILLSPPFGEETFKVFLSASPLDLEDILTTKTEAEAKAKSSRGILDGLEKLFVESNINETGTRGVTATSINTQQNGTVFSFNFQIVPK
jgi:hypothetical protein